MDNGSSLNVQRQLVREVVDQIELVRLKRRVQWRDGRHPDCKRFTQEELCGLAYGAYKNMVLGRTLRIPLRADLLRIADYLECTIHETNDLLMAAQYLPEVVELRENQYRSALEQGRLILAALPLPAVVVSHGWRIEAMNSTMIALNNSPPVEQIPRAQRTGMHWFLQPDLPSYTAHAPDHATFLSNAQNMTLLFRVAHQPFLRETWFKDLIARLQNLPEFDRLWNRSASMTVDDDDIGINTTQTPFFSTPIRDRNMVMRLGAGLFPHIVIGVPLDDAAQTAYQRAGCPITESRWEHALSIGCTSG